MATGSNVIAALRGGGQAPMTAMAPQVSGVSFFDPMAQTAMPPQQAATLPSTLNALRGNNAYTLNDPAMLTLPTAIPGSARPPAPPKPKTATPATAAPATAAATGPNPFAQGQATNQRFGEAFKQQMGYDMPDMAPYTGPYAQQYASEMSSPQGMANLAQDMSYAQSGGGGIYQGDDLVPVIGGAAATGTAGDWWNNNYDAVFGNGNSFFLPDSSEVTFVPQEVLGAFRTDGETDDQVHDRLYYGNSLLNAGGDPIRPEYDIRGLMNVQQGKYNNYGYNTYNDALGAAANELASFDVGRGSVNRDQGYALSRGLEFKNQFDQYESTLQGFRDQIANDQRRLEEGTFYDPRSPYTQEEIDALRADIESNIAANEARVAQGNPFAQPYNEAMANIEGLDPTGLSTALIIERLRGG